MCKRKEEGRREREGGMVRKREGGGRKKEREGWIEIERVGRRERE